MQDSASCGRSTRAVQGWLLAVAALVVATLIVGGATRLTESGLSIVEWKPVTGTIPPLGEAQWLAEFEKYKAIPQYREVNRGMSLEQFKTIFWWEWAHRLLGRLVGVAYLAPFLFFLWRGWIGPRWRNWLWGLFALGALQGAAGWWMVASGLTERISVSQYRLAFHMTLACVIYAALIWTVLRMHASERARARARHRLSALALAFLVVVQIYLGALVAGLDGGMSFNTWPLIDGAFVPAADRLWFESPLWRNLFENIVTVQFNHRMAAYLLVAASILHAADMTAAGGAGRTGAWLLAGAVALQSLVGIFTLLQQVPMPLAMLHQALAIVVLTIAVVHAERLTGAVRRGSAPALAAAR